MRVKTHPARVRSGGDPHPNPLPEGEGAAITPQDGPRPVAPVFCGIGASRGVNTRRNSRPVTRAASFNGFGGAGRRRRVQGQEGGGAGGEDDHRSRMAGAGGVSAFCPLSPRERVGVRVKTYPARVRSGGDPHPNPLPEGEGAAITPPGGDAGFSCGIGASRGVSTRRNSRPVTWAASSNGFGGAGRRRRVQGQEGGGAGGEDDHRSQMAGAGGVSLSAPSPLGRGSG